MNKKAVWLLPYKGGSASAKVLAERLGIRRLKKEGSKWKPRANRTVINWGCGNGNYPKQFDGANFINLPDSVSTASNKHLCLIKLEEGGVPIVPWTTKKTVAIAEADGGGVVYCRTKLQGHSGDGIVVAHKPEEVVDAPLYTTRLGAKWEFRAHVVFGKVVDVRRKAKVEGHEGNKYVKNHANGYVFKKFDIQVPDDVNKVAIDAVKAVGLDFGAVDILYYKDKAYVLEINTACGIEGSTVDSYAEAFEEALN